MSRPASTVPSPARQTHHARRAHALPGWWATPSWARADVSRAQERRRHIRLRRLVAVARPGPRLDGHPRRSRATSIFPSISLPHALGRPVLPILIIVGLLGLVMVGPFLGAGRSPHTLIRPGETERRAGRRGGHRRDQGRSGALDQPLPGPSDLPRHHGRLGPAGRAVRGAAGDRQDLRGQGDGQGGPRPVPLRLGVGLPVDVLRPDQPQDPLLLQAAAQVRAPEGGAIGFIEEIDAIGASRRGMGGGGGEGISGVVNELLVQLQSFDKPSRGQRMRGSCGSTCSTATCPTSGR